MGVIQVERKAPTPRADGLEHKSMLHQGPLAPIETKMIDEHEGIVEAFVAVTGIVDRVNDIIEPGAIGPQLKAMWPVGAENHDWGKRVAKTLEAEEYLPGDPRLPSTLRDGTPWPAEAGALWVKTQFNLEKESGRDAFSDVKFYADQQDWSIGYRAMKSRRDKDGIRYIKQMEIPEYSTVLSGAHKQARTLSIKSDELEKGAASVSDGPRVIATFDDYVVFSSKGFGEDEPLVPGSMEAKLDAAENAVENILHTVDISGDEMKAWKVPIHVDENGFVVTGEPERVPLEIVGEKGDVVTEISWDSVDEMINLADAVKSGRVLSTANKAKVRAAMDALGEVLTAAEARALEEAAGEGETVEGKGDNGMAKKPHDYVAGDNGKCATCGTASGNPMHQVGKAAPAVEAPESSAEATTEAEWETIPHVFVDDGTGLCAKCGDPIDAAQHVTTGAVKAAPPADAKTHAYVPGPFGKCKTCGKPESDPVHNVAAAKADPGVGGGGPDAMTHEYVKGPNGYCAKCGGTMKCAIHDGPFGQAYSGPIDGVGHEIASKHDHDLNDIEIMMMERERLTL